MTNTSEKKQRLERKRRKAEKIIFAIGITAVVFVVATYAWFIGTTQVAVSAFTLSIKSGDGLTMSLTGKPGTFENEISIDADTIDALLTSEYTAEAGNRNNWPTSGLVPISTIGNVNADKTGLLLFNKSAISSLTGGYRLRAEAIDNKTAESSEYVTFDLFLKNTSGTGYNADYQHFEDEGIYLIKNSYAKLQAAGVEPDAGGDGIENSIRLAFVQLGRVNQNAELSVIQGIGCKTEGGVTSLCDAEPDGRGVTWNIWEPNDTSHNQASKDHFEMICKVRNDANSYGTACSTDEWTDGYAPTFAVKSRVIATDNVNIYDGLNGYEGSSTFIEQVDYFTDTEKNADDPGEIFYLNPNSITKIRVYIYLEGQDVDNYDLGTYGKDIEIMFGFTKDKYSMAEEEAEEPVVEGS